MGWGKALSAVVVMSISVMLVVTVLPVGAHDAKTGDPTGSHGSCNGNWTSISISEAMDKFGLNPISKDKNDNDHVCWKMKGNGEYQFKDDRPVK